MKLTIFLIMAGAATAFAGVRKTYFLFNNKFSLIFIPLPKQKVQMNADAMDKYMAIAKECAGKEGASDADIQAAMSFKLPTTSPGKCLSACVGEQIKVVSHLTQQQQNSVKSLKTNQIFSIHSHLC